TNSVIKAAGPTKGESAVGHLQQAEGIASRPLVGGTAGMIGLVGCMEPVVNPQREGPARHLSGEAGTRHSRDVNVDPQSVKDPHCQVIVIHPSRFRATNLEMPRQSSMTVEQALPHPVHVVLLLIPDVVWLGKTPC